MKKERRLSKTTMLALEKDILSGALKFNRKQKRVKSVQMVRSMFAEEAKIIRKQRLRERVLKRRETKYFTIAYKGARYRFKSNYGRSGKPITSIINMEIASFTYLLTIPKAVIPDKNPKTKILAAYEDEVLGYVRENLQKLCIDNIIRQTVIRNKTSIKIQSEVVYKPKSILYTLRMCNVDIERLITKIRRDIRVTKGIKHYD